MVFRVDEETSERVDRNLDGSMDSFCWFSTLKGHDIAIALDSIDLVNFLWESRGFADLEPDDAEQEDHLLRIRFKGRDEPYKAQVEEAVKVFDLFRSLEWGSYNDAPFLYFTDEDGERVLIDGRKVLFVEASTGLLDEGAKQAEEQLALEEKAVESEPPKKSPRSKSTELPGNF